MCRDSKYGQNVNDLLGTEKTHTMFRFISCGTSSKISDFAETF